MTQSVCIRTARLLEALVVCAGLACRTAPTPVSWPLYRSMDYPDTTPGNFLALWNCLDQEYPLFAARDLDWNQVRSKYGPLAAVAQREEELWTVCGALIAELDDLHVTLSSPQFGTAFSRPPASPSPPALESSQRPFTYRVLENALIIRIHHFLGTVAQAGWVSELESVLRRYKSLKAVIVDLRANPGGNHRVARHVAEAFAHQREHYLSIRSKTGRAHDAFGPEVRWYLSPRRAWPQKPALLITDGATASAAEVFVLAMRTQSNTVQVGEPTAGAWGDVEERSLPNGWKLTLPVNLFLDARGNPPMAKGIQPAPNAQSAVKSFGLDTLLAQVLQDNWHGASAMVSTLPED